MNDRDDREERVTGLLGPAGPELTCVERFDALDRYVEAELQGTAADQQVPGMQAHLRGCGACAEDHESLLTLVREELEA